jgi:hypothetical protein
MKKRSSFLSKYEQIGGQSRESFKKEFLTKLVVCSIIFSLFSASCVTKIPYSSQEICAFDNLLLAGTSSSSSQGGAYASGGYATAEAHSTNRHCVRPTSVQEECEIEAQNASIPIKVDWNSNKGMRNLALFVGYYFFVVPGLIMYFVFKSSRSKAYQDAYTAAAQAKKQCEMKLAD